MKLMSAIFKNVINATHVACFRLDLYRAFVTLLCTAIDIHFVGNVKYYRCLRGRTSPVLGRVTVFGFSR